jgi:hypothetical protein
MVRLCTGMCRKHRNVEGGDLNYGRLWKMEGYERNEL